jgi:SAM-dependent methyltransferase
MDDPKLSRQLDYYRARAGEYDDWWFRTGRYDRGPEANARTQALGASVTYVEADLFSWEPPRHAFDACVFGFWLSHVPEDRFAPFWTMVSTALRPDGRVLLIDSRRAPRSKARDHTMPGADASLEQRRLDDGRELEIVKRYYEPAALAEQLVQLGWECELHSTGEFFIYGTATLAPG